MTEYRRFYIPKAMWFFTVNLAERKNNHLLITKIDELRNAFRYVKQRKPFHIDAIVILPDHLHCIWTLPPNDGNFSVRWNMLKGRFSRSIDHGERISKSRQKRRERGIWQRRLWAHLIEDQEDYNRHIDYIHWNPVKHGHVKNVIDWPYSSFHQYVKQGIYSNDWGVNGQYEIQDVE
ncbi:transposase [Methylomonas sp. LL1]|uniref:REP-associated tyrosine transposase n=1 Tax=Methylomonas sp. LL1 TaxID=2785785 RepID=UPI0018C3F833|nr:transposase [Methylomonas sp. LL1]QPK64521.1 transposase [Methylomonas sp. LL1]